MACNMLYFQFILYPGSEGMPRLEGIETELEFNMLIENACLKECPD